MLSLTALSLVGCGSNPLSNLSDDSVTKEFYQGTTTVVDDQGTEGTEEMLLIRTTDAEASTVRIDVRTWTEGSDYVGKNWLDLTLTGDATFSLTGYYIGENIEGEGTFDGEPTGTWAQWNYRGHVSNDPDIRIESEAAISDAGLVAGKSLLFYGDGEAPIVTITDTLSPKSIDDSDFAALVERLMSDD